MSVNSKTIKSTDKALTLMPTEQNMSVISRTAKNTDKVLTSHDGTKYVGEYKDGDMHGQGTYLVGGDQYVGDFKDGNRHGRGTYTYASGAKYVGEYKDNKKHGQGTYVWRGEKYVGEYKDGDMHGQGTYTLSVEINMSVTSKMTIDMGEALILLPMEQNMSVNT